MSESLAARRHPVATLVVVATVGLLLAATLTLWAHFGTAVFFEMMRSGFIACFG